MIYKRIIFAIQNILIMEVTLRKPTMFRLKTDLIDCLKIAAKRENRSLNNYVESVLMDVVYHEPNAETKLAIEEAKRGEYAGEIDLFSIESMVKSIES